MKLGLYACVLCALLLSACSDNPNKPESMQDDTNSDHPTFSKSSGDIDLKDRYIVVFKEWVGNVDQTTDQIVKQHGGVVHYRYRTALKGFAATLPAEALNGIRNNPNVDYIEADQIMSINTDQSNPPSWGLDRIDQHPLPLDNTYSYLNDGSGVTVYIIDTGIRFDHQEFGGRASSVWDFIDNDADASDCHGHGTHVAGTVGGSTVGVAKNVLLKAVRVLNCSGSGSTSGVIAGIDRVTAVHSGPSVANMSLGGGYSSSLNQAVNNSVAAGVVYAVAAGNNGANACNYSPASAVSALTIGATTNTDARSSFSNYGSCVDLFAPGSGIYSSTISGTNTYASWNGTSMATPHVAGVAALYLGTHSTATPAQVETAIKAVATSGLLSGIGTGSPNLLLYSLFGGSPPAPPSAPTSLTATAASANQIDLSWADNSGNEDGFKIERSADNVTFSQIATVGSNVTTFANTGLPATTTYYYQVRAYNSGGNSGYSNTAYATTQSSPTLHVGGLSSSTSKKGSRWTASLTITVHDAFHQSVSGATVYVTLSGGASGTQSATTNSAGQCTISTAKLSGSVSSVTMSVTNLSKSGTTYDSIADHPNPPTMTINKP